MSVTINHVEVLRSLYNNRFQVWINYTFKGSTAVAYWPEVKRAIEHHKIARTDINGGITNDIYDAYIKDYSDKVIKAKKNNPNKMDIKIN